MKSRCRWKGETGQPVPFWILFIALLPLVPGGLAQGTRHSFTSGQSIVPRGFQPFTPQGSLFHHNPHNPLQRSSSSSATSVQNTQFDYFPNSGSKPSFPPPTFIGLAHPPKGQGHHPNGNSNLPSAEYEYYDEPEEEIIYQYDTADHNHKPQSRFPVQKQTFTTANLGAKSTLRPSSPGFLRETKLIPLEPEAQQQPRSVPARPHSNLNGNAIRPPVGLLRPSTGTTATTSTSTTAKTTTTTPRSVRTTTTKRTIPSKARTDILRNLTTSKRPGALTIPPRSRFSSINRGTKTPSSTEPQIILITSPSSVEKRKSGNNHKYSVEQDYTVEEYGEYPTGSKEGSGQQQEYYELSEEKERLEKDKMRTSVTVSSSSSTSTATSTSTTTTTPAPKEKVVVSVSSSKTVLTTPSKKSVAPTKSVVTSTTSTTKKPSTAGIKDSVPSGAETSPEYYEEEYSYHEAGNPGEGHKGHSHVSTSSSSSSSSNAEEEEEPRHPQPRKLPSKKEMSDLTRFETLVDIGDLNSEGRIPLLGNNEQEEVEQETEEEEEEEHHSHPSSTTSKPTTSTTAKTTITTTTTTAKPVLPFGNIKFAEVSADLLPPGFKLSPEPTTTAGTTTTTTSTTTTTTTTPAPEPSVAPVVFDEIPAFLLPKGYKPLGRPAPKSPSTITTTTSTTTGKPDVDIGSIPLHLLPKGFKLPPVEDLPATTAAPSVTTTTPASTTSVLEAILSKVKFQEVAIPSLVPKDFKPAVGVPTNLLPPGYKAPEPAIPANLLPPGFKLGESSEAPSPATTKKPISGPVFPTRPPSGGLIFPTKPGGFRAARPSSTEPPKADTPPPPRVTIGGGWPIRKTTEFTGWPTQPTTPMPPTQSTTTEFTTTTTTTTPKPTTTTSPPPPKRSPLGTCPHEVCRLEATIRITGGLKWKPEFADINTEEYKHLEQTVRRELDGAYRASGLAPWYKRVQIEGFNQGSVLVDYFVELEGVDRELSTADVVKVFHKSLLDSDPGDELPQETEAPGALRFGRFNLDPRYTDYKVVNAKTGKGAVTQPDPLIPQWGIAIIVIGIVSLLFVIILGVIVLVSRYKNSKKKNAVSLTQEMLNEFNKSHMAVSGGVDNYGADDLYNMDDVWNDSGKPVDRTFDRRPTKRSQSSAKGSANYNIYDSWKTEWNGYYYNGAYYGDSGYAPSRRRSDYDTNF